MKNSVLFCFVAMLSCLAIQTFARQGIGVNIAKSFPTPNVASLGTFGLVPANPYNGQANVSVPLYTVAYKDLTIPITLSYATRGNKPDDHPGWTGLGWGFQAGGMIFRKVNGLYDEHPAGVSPNMSGSFNLSYLDNCGRVSSNFNNLDTIAAYGLYSNQNILAYAFDGIPDEFVFNFNEYSGVFYITRASINGPIEIKVRPNGNYKLKAEILEIKNNLEFDDWIPNGSTAFTKRRASRTIYGFKITDDKGVDYIFGGNPAAIEFGNNGNFTLDFYTIANTWHLTEIISSAGYRIKLTYKKKGRVIQQGQQRNATFYSNNVNYGNNLGFLFSATSGTNTYSGSLDNTFFMIQNPSWLDSIKTPQQTITFTSSRSRELDYPIDRNKLWEIMDPAQYKHGGDSSHWQKLDAIHIHGHKTIHFNYRHQSGSRLRLDSIEFKTVAAVPQKIMGYGFKYDPLSLPAYNARMDDHWGYYNGRSYAYGGSYETTREPVAQYLQAEMLQQINYPTGGYLKLEYEPHYYKKIAKQFPFEIESVSNNAMAGGLRIKKMTSTTGANDIPVTKEYFYTVNYQLNGAVSSGVLSGLPQYTNTGTARSSYRTGHWWAGNWGSFSLYFGSMVDNNFLQLSSTNGHHITYSEVTEKSGKGFTIYKYNNHDNGYHDKAPYIMYTNFDSHWHEEGFTSLASFRGLPYQTTVYNEAKKPVKQVRISYFMDTSGAYKVPTFHRTGPSIPSYNLTRVSTCAFFTKPALPRTTTDVEFVAATGDSMVSVTNYRYYPDVYPSGAAANDNFKQAESSMLNSSLETIKKQQRYPAYMVLNGADPTGVYQEMVNRNVVTPVVEELSFKNTTQLELVRNNYYKPYSSIGIYAIKTTEVKPFSDSNEIRYQAYNYDTKGNVTEQAKTNDAREVILWGYLGQFPVAKITGSTYAAASVLVSSTMLDNATVHGDDAVRTELNKLRTKLPGAMVTTYTWLPGRGITSETDYRGYTKYYEYDDAGRLKVIRDQNKYVLQKFCYSYAGSSVKCDGTVYNSVGLSKTFTKQGCTGCNIGSQVTYTVPAGKYYSELSKADADAKAQADMDANGQANANTNGICYAPPIFVKQSMINYSAPGLFQTADLVFEFFSDTNYTVPYSVTNLKVNYRITTNYCGSNPNTSSGDRTVTCTGVKKVITGVEVSHDLEDGIHCYYNSYALLPGSCYYDVVYYSSARNEMFYRNNCPSGMTGTGVTYAVPYGKYRSVVSQAAADAPATAEIAAYGQANANANGSCVYYNVERSQSFTRNNCPSPQYGTAVTYTVAARRYSSTVSQADADARAQSDINTNGQNYANINGLCRVPGFPYVRMTLTNYQTNGFTTTATMVFSFYSDPARSVPMSVTNLRVNYHVTTHMCDGQVSSGSVSTVCNGTSYNIPVTLYHDIGDGLHCYSADYTLLGGTGYYH